MNEGKNKWDLESKYHPIKPSPKLEDSFKLDIGSSCKVTHIKLILPFEWGYMRQQSWQT